MTSAHFTQRALETATTDQIAAVARLMNPETVELVDIAASLGALGLPPGWLEFRREFFSGGQPEYGGIAPNGDVST